MEFHVLGAGSFMVVLICISLISNEAEHLFMSLDTQISSSVKGLFISSAHFSSGFFFRYCHMKLVYFKY